MVASIIICWMNKWIIKRHMLCVYYSWVVMWLNRHYVHFVVLSLTISYFQPWTKALTKALSWDPSIATRSLPPALKSIIFSSPFYLPWNPTAVKSVKLEVDEDKSTKGSNFSNSEVAIGLSPYTFPQKRLFHVPEENIAWAGVCLAERYSPISLGSHKKKGGGEWGGSSVRCDNMPVSPMIREA